jgi:hypothetical protein
VSSSIEILREACRARAPVSVVNLDQVSVYRSSRLRSLRRTALTIDVSGRGKRLREGARCCVIFTHHGDPMALFCTVLESPPRSSQVVLEVPLKIPTTRERKRYRVPVMLGSGLSIQARAGDHGTIAAKALDVTSQGTRIEFTEEHDPDLAVGTKLELEFLLDEYSVLARATVRHRAGHKYGLLLSAVLDSRGPAPSRAFREIVTNLKRQWLEKRIREDVAGRLLADQLAGMRRAANGARRSS